MMWEVQTVRFHVSLYNILTTKKTKSYVCIQKQGSAYWKPGKQARD
jgi:hypothetical protein